MGGIGSGPQKTPTTLIKEAKERDSKNLPRYFEKLSELALQGDRESLFYLIDRHMGKPKAVTELDIEGGEHLGVGLMVELLKGIAENKRKLLEEGKNVPEVAENVENG